MSRLLVGLLCLAAVVSAAWLGASGSADKAPAAWTEVAPGVLRGPGLPAGYALFSGDALAEPGKLWSPYTTDWDHWTDAGLVPTARSLRKLAELKPAVLLPAHGPVIDKDAVSALEKTAAAVEEVGFLKSYERYTK